jgi:hypothetical protein
MIVLPAALAITKPDVLTLATFPLLDDHDTALFVALVGAIVAVSWNVPPTVSDRLETFSDTPVTGTVAGVTVIAQVAVLFPSAVFTVIVAVPAALAITIPEA